MRPVSFFDKFFFLLEADKFCRLNSREIAFTHPLNLESKVSTLVMPKTPAPRSYKPAPRVKASDGQFIIHNGLRKILPYEHTFRAYCKQRWIGQTIYNLCTTEFRDRTQEFYVKTIRAITNMIQLLTYNLIYRKKQFNKVLSQSTRK